MIHVLTNLSPVAVIVVSVLGFGFGAAWYSPYLFAKAWMEEMKTTPETMKSRPGRMPTVIGGSFLLAVVSTITLAALISAHHSTGALRGADFGLLVGGGLVAAREATNALYEGRTLRHFLIVSGHDAGLCVFQGGHPGRVALIP
jgi:hypothetical protein